VLPLVRLSWLLRRLAWPAFHQRDAKEPNRNDIENSTIHVQIFPEGNRAETKELFRLLASS